MEQFSDKRIDPHPVRLFAIYRSLNSSKKEDLKHSPPLVCLSVQVVLFHHLFRFCKESVIRSIARN